MPNVMKFEQVAALLTNAVEQTTGQKVISAITNPEQLISTAQTTIALNGLDPIINQINQIIGRTIFSTREYDAPFKSLEYGLERFGNATRKISPVAKPMQDDGSYKYPTAYDAAQVANPLGNGQSVDHYKINKQEVLTTFFYGSAVFEQFYTTFRDQFECAFTDAAQLGQFLSMLMTERFNDRESYRESVGRILQLNMIGAILDEGNNDRVIHLLSEYNTQTGLSLTAQSVYQPTNFSAFMRWVYARVRTIVRNFGIRSQMYQTVISNKPILRHAKPSDIRIALFAPALDQIETMVKSDTFHDDYLKFATYEGITHWQSIETPDSISVTPSYTSTSGTVKSGSATEQAGIFGFIHDKNMLGYSAVYDQTATTPLNIEGNYYNTVMRTRYRTISDNTEKGVVLLLD